RKIKLETILRPEYHEQLIDRIVNMSIKFRDIIVRSQFFFVKYYILCQNDQPVNKKIYTQNSWYFMT
ncbi:hypothetical protein BDF14DRAFT_1726508, partial [Spinellus fusiger]